MKTEKPRDYGRAPTRQLFALADPRPDKVTRFIGQRHVGDGGPPWAGYLAKRSPEAKRLRGWIDELAAEGLQPIEAAGVVPRVPVTIEEGKAIAAFVAEQQAKLGADVLNLPPPKARKAGKVKANRAAGSDDVFAGLIEVLSGAGGPVRLDVWLPGQPRTTLAVK